MDRRNLLFYGAGAALGAGALLGRRSPARAAPLTTHGAPYKVSLTPAEWRRKLTPAEFDVLREAGTEAPFTSPLLNEHRRGTFACAGCALPAFASATKFDSGTGWPSFYAPLPRAVDTSSDHSLFEARTEVHCSRCGGHLGHVFDDGPKPTGLRYCMNGVALAFHPV